MPNNKCMDLYGKIQNFTKGHRRLPELIEK